MVDSDAVSTSSVTAARVRDIMTSPVISVSPTTPTGDIADLLRRNRISGVPVIDESGAAIGLVSEYDLLKQEGATARDVMTPGVVSVTSSTPIDDVRVLLVDRHFRRVPVVDGGELVGIVSRGDVIALMATEWVCEVCGESCRGRRPPDRCAKCHGGPERFALQEQLPGA